MKKIFILSLAIILLLILILISSFMKKVENISVSEIEAEVIEVSENDSEYVTESLLLKEENRTEVNSIKPLFPKMIEVRNEKNDLNIEISETLITMEEYRSYLLDTNPRDADMFEIWAKDLYGQPEYIQDWPIRFVWFKDIINYCNWLSRRNRLAPVYFYVNDKMVIDRTANGYRLPYVRELLILSGLKDGLTKDEYERENTFDKKDDPIPVYEGKKNRYGIYDLLGNMPQYCNDYYLKGYDYFDYEKNPYGPDEYTPDEEELEYVSIPTPVRCIFGCFPGETYELMKKYVIRGTLERSKSYLLGIRVVRDILSAEEE